MPRAVNGTIHKEKRKKILKQTRGFYGRRSKLYRPAKDALAMALTYAYRDRKNRKRTFRSLWITRISAACRQEGMTYSEFIGGLARAGIIINRKALSNMAIEDPKAFSALLAQIKTDKSKK